MFDTIVIGGGIMGCCAALDLADAGMKVAVIERTTLCSGASGVNAGSHSMQNKRLPLVPYALRAKEMWAKMSARLDYDVGYRRNGGLIVALTDSEAAETEEKTKMRKDLGADIEMVSGDHAREIEPLLSKYIIAASYSRTDGYSDTLRTGRAFKRAFKKLGVQVHEYATVTRIVRGDGKFEITAGEEKFVTKRILLAAGAWLKELLSMLDVNLPVDYRLNQAMVLDRVPDRLQNFIGHSTGLLTLKQSEAGKLLLGGGWVAEGDAQIGSSSLLTESITGNLRLAARILPAARQTKLIRVWSGFEADMPDYLPLAGSIPYVENAFVIGCVGGGYTIGPYLAHLVGQHILGQATDLPLFDPARFVN